jgi:[protein-PII] uridylyltransferase
MASAHIDGYGERAVDAFYVTGPKGQKVTDARKGNALKAALLAALNHVDQEEPRRVHLQRARASVAR